MGQRLIVDIIKNNERVASIYFHGSAYFATTIFELANLSQYILNTKDNEDVLLSILNCLEENGGGLRGFPDPEYVHDKEKATELFPTHEFKTDFSRSDGIITFTEEGMKAFDYWGEGFAEIEIDTLKIHNGVSYCGEDWLEYNYMPLGDDGEGGYIQEAKSGIVKGCNIDAFEMTCNSVIELADYLSNDDNAKQYMRRSWKNDHLEPR